MNILHVIQRYWPYVGGSESYFQELGERLAREGHRVMVFTSDAWDIEHFWSAGRRTIPVAEEAHNGVQIRRFPVKQLPLAPLSYLGLRFAMAELSNLPVDMTRLLMPASRLTPWLPTLDRTLDRLAERYDVVHATNVPFDSLLYAAFRFARRTRSPLVVTPFVHLGVPRERRILKYYTTRNQMAILRAAEAVIVQTDLEGEELVRHGIKRERLHRIGVGINPGDLEGGQAARFRAKYGIEGPVVFTLGTTAYDKGTFHLVQAMERLWEAGREATLVIAGPTMSAFTKFFAAQSDRVKAHTRVLGFIPDADRRDLLAAGDVFVLASCTDSFGIVYLEAWFYNKPVIGARAGGVPEVIGDGRDGYLIEFGDVQALAGRIGELLDNPQRRQGMGEAGRAKVLRDLTWDKKYAQVRAVYEAAANGG